MGSVAVAEYVRVPPTGSIDRPDKETVHRTRTVTESTMPSPPNETDGALHESSPVTAEATTEAAAATAASGERSMLATRAAPDASSHTWWDARPERPQ
jgi:hypothetical protein